MRNNNTYDRFSGRGQERIESGKNGLPERVVFESRSPIYLVLILDTSSSMSGCSTVINEMGEAVSMRKIDQLNDGMRRVMKSLKAFLADNPLYRPFLQIIELNSYGKALFDEFQPISRDFEEINFEASGCTELRASLNTLKTFINHKYLRDDRPERAGKAYNKSVPVILMSDGWPTDQNGIEQKGPAYRSTVDEFKAYLREMGYDRNVDLYSIAVGDDACEDMLRYFCDGDGDVGPESHFYRVDECESIATALDFVTRATLAYHTNSPIKKIDEEEEEENTNEPDADEVAPEEEGESPEEDYIEVDYVDNDETDGNTVDEDDTGETDADEIAIDEEDAPEDDFCLGKDAGKANIYQVDLVRCKKDTCAACLACNCLVDAIEMSDGIVRIDAQKCIGCGACADLCPERAIVHAESDAELDDLFSGIDSDIDDEE